MSVRSEMLTFTLGNRDGVPGYWFSDGMFIPSIGGGETPPGDPPAADPPAPADPPDNPDDFDKDRAMATIRQLREKEKAGKTTAKELADARQKLKEIEDAGKTETERLAATAKETGEKLTVAEKRSQDLAVQLHVERAARKLNFIDDDDAFRLIDRTAITMDDDGNPTNVEALLTALAKSKPHLVKPESDGNGNKPPTPRSTPPSPKPAASGSSGDEVDKLAERMRASPGVIRW